MSVYPYNTDSDATIPRVDDNLSELGTEVINLIRDAIFAIEAELGINPSGTLNSLKDFLGVSFNENGTIKASALTSVGLVSLPIVDSHVGASAGIKEYKLTLDHSTTDLYSLISTNSTKLTSLETLATSSNADLLTHVGGGAVLSDTSPGRHVASHIDINATPSDSRDALFTWTGLVDKDSNPRSATHVASALYQINTELVDHQNATADAHTANAIVVDTSDFTEIPTDATDVQAALDAIDDMEVVNVGTHRAVMHANGIPRTARSLAMGASDGYSREVIPETPVIAHAAHGAANPIDDSSLGDDIIKFDPDNTDYIFDSQFAKVRVGDVVRINYGNGLEASYEIDSIRFTPGSEWVVRINGVNLADTDGYSAYARIDKPLFDMDTFGVLAVGSANNDLDVEVEPSLIVANPRSASVLGIGFNPDKLDSTHYKLYINLYPTGNPADKVIAMPEIDVTGNAGATPGRYTLSSVVDATNDAFRKGGYNFRFHAFSHDGEFGIALSDAINGASFSITNGVISGASIVTGAFTENVVGDALDGTDPLGLGSGAANVAGPDYLASFGSASAALLATKVIMPMKRRSFVVNGARRDTFAPTYMATVDTNGDGYWVANVKDSIVAGSTVRTTYRVSLDLRAAGLKFGKTITIQPALPFDDAAYKDADYGRFIIRSVFFDDCLGPNPATEITVINSIHGTASALGSIAPIGEDVYLYFSEDTVSLNNHHASDPAPTMLDATRLHEVYIDDYGNTFSHERARMPRQAAAGALLGTEKFHIRDVSPKLRGYAESTNDTYVRFYVLRYDSVTGEFDGYIGKRDGSSIVNAGPIATARKGEPIRFYDESSIDYVELEFVETIGTTNPGTSILSSSTPQYADIKLFPSLELNDAFLLLAKCETRKEDSGFTIVSGVRDARQFGNLSEKNFTTSAIDFIQAGERNLHSNGIIRGFEYVGLDVSNDKKLFFNGGVALVNGAFSMVNNGSVIIPIIQEEGDTLPQVYTWAVCVNAFNQFDAILITSARQQFFATQPGGSTSFYVQSATFDELIAKRKDLTPIAMVTTTIASITIDSVEDARKFIADETSNIPLTWVPEPKRIGFPDTGNSGGKTDAEREVIGHFHTFEAVKSWINNYGSANNTIKVRGRINVTSPIDLNALNYPVTFEGENAEISVQNDRGFLLGSNVTMRELTFSYDVTGESITEDLIKTGNGILYLDMGSTDVIENISIEKCIFTSNIEGHRHPYINVEMDGGAALFNFNVDGCRFDEDDALTAFMAAIAIISTNGSGTETNAAVLADSRITNNICTRYQGIHVTSDADTALNYIKPGLQTMNVEISGNTCAAIGYMTASTKELNPIFLTAEKATRNKSLSLNIKDNNCLLITHTSSTGHQWKNTTNATIDWQTSGHVTISNNFCNWIHVSSMRGITDLEESSLIISGNTLQAANSAGLQNWKVSAASDINNIAILVGSVRHNSNYGPGDNVQIINNSINSQTVSISSVDTTHYYDVGIGVECGGVISGNNISGISTGYGTFGGGRGIVLLDYAATKYVVSDNIISRGSKTIASYIWVYSSTNGASVGVIKDNVFDDQSNGTDYDVIQMDGSAFDYSSWTTIPNKNQRVTRKLLPVDFGTYGEGISSLGINSTPSIVNSIKTATLSSSAFTANVSAAAGYFSLSWVISLEDLFPMGVQILEISLPVSVGTVNWTVADFYINIFHSNTTTMASVKFDATTATSGTITVTDSFSTNDTKANVVVAFSGQNPSTTQDVKWKGMDITYTY